MKQPVVLKIYHNDRLETVRQFTDKQIVIGRGAESQMQLNDDSVSLLHAMIEERGDGQYYVSDLGSTSGTMKNGHAVLEEKLNSGDQIDVGIYRIQFFVGVPKAAAPQNPGSFAVEPPPVNKKGDDISMKPAAPILTNPSKPKATPPPTPKATPPPMPSKPIPSVDEPKRSAAFMQASKKGKTFAPPSAFKDSKDFIKPGKGNLIEVLVCWGERVLSTNHFSGNKDVYIGGSPTADVMVPVLTAGSQFHLLKAIGGGVTVNIAPEMTGEVVRDNDTVTVAELARQNKLRSVGGNYELDLRQGEMVKLNLVESVSIIIRYKNDVPKPIVAPLLDLSASEVTGVILAGVISAIFALYMNLYAPPNLLDDEAKLEEPIRKAVVQFSAPKVMEDKPVEPKEEKKKVVEVTEKRESTKAEKKTVDSKKEKTSTKAQSVASPGAPGAAGDIKPSPLPKKNKLVSVRPKGGAIKTGAKEGANMKSDKPDPTKVGLLGVFSKGGTQSKLDKAYSGAGELQGMADAATGAAGSNEDRAGDSMGGKLKDTGGGGKGSNTVGIAGLGTKGRGTGTTGYGTGGLGSKGSVRVDVGGQDADFQGSIDREAIRRVIRDHFNEIRFCYDRELQKNGDLAGKIVIAWNIDERGRANNAGVTSNALGNANVANCIVNKLKTWGFPPAPPDVIAHVSYPFVFSSN